MPVSPHSHVWHSDFFLLLSLSFICVSFSFIFHASFSIFPRLDCRHKPQLKPSQSVAEASKYSSPFATFQTRASNHCCCCCYYTRSTHFSHTFVTIPPSFYVSLTHPMPYVHKSTLSCITFRTLSLSLPLSSFTISVFLSHIYSFSILCLSLSHTLRYIHTFSLLDMPGSMTSNGK